MEESRLIKVGDVFCRRIKWSQDMFKILLRHQDMMQSFIVSK